MKILLIIPEEFKGKRWGGVTTYTIELAQELYKHGHEVSILTPGRINRLYFYKGIRINTIPLSRTHPIIVRFIFKFLRLLSSQIEERLLWAYLVKKFVFSYGPFDNIEAPEWGSSTLFLLFSRKYSITVRLHKSWMMYVLDNQWPITVSVRFLDFLERWCILRATLVTSPTKFMLSQYRYLMWIRKVCHKSTKIILCGIRMQNSRIASAPPYKNYILTVGRIERGKGSVLLAESFKSLYKHNKRLHLVFVGEDTKMFFNKKWISCKAYIKTILHPSIQSHVHFISRQTRRSLHNYYKNCLFYITPSYGHENQSIALLEAISYGKSAIGSNTGGTPEVIQHQQNGLLFCEGNVTDLTKKLEYMLRHPLFRKHCERRSLSERMKYDIHHTASQTLQAYKASLLYE